MHVYNLMDVHNYLMRSQTAMSYHLDKMIEIIDVEMFIQDTHEILDKIKRNPTYAAKAQEEAHILLAQFEEYLKSKGLEV